VTAVGQGLLHGCHPLADIFDVSDRIIVLRLGRRVATFSTHTTNPEQVVVAITGAVFGALDRMSKT
jgi:D-xylose transport system ATP-binding protein